MLPASGPTDTSPLAARALPAALLLAGLWLVPMAILGADFSRMPGEPCDSGFSSLVLEHGWRFLTGAASSYFGAPFLYPFEGSITLSDNFLSTLPVYAALRALGLSREGAYQGWFLALFVLNYACAYWALRRLGNTRGPAALGAYLFAFMAPAIEEVTHPALLHLFPIPLAVAGFVRWAESGSVRAFAGMCAAVALQFYGAFYLGAFLALALLMFALSWLAVNRRMGGEWSLFKLEKLVLCLAGVGLALAPLAFPYLRTSSENGFARFWPDVVRQLPSPGDLFLASPGNLLWGWATDSGDILSFNNAMHMGLLPWAGMAAYLVMLARGRGRRAVTAALLAPLGLTLLCLRFGEESLFKLVQWMPVLGSMRALTRVVLVDAFFVILVLTWTARELLSRMESPAARRAAFALLALAAMADQYNTLLPHYGYDKAKRLAEVAAVEAEFASLGRARAVAYLPGNGPGSQGGDASATPGQGPASTTGQATGPTTGADCRVTVAAMLAAQDLSLPVVNAYTSWFPKGYGFFDRQDCAGLSRWMLRTQAASDRPLWDGLALAGPGAADCRPAVAPGKEQARAALLREFRETGRKRDLPWALGLKGIDALGVDELWLGARGEIPLRPGESLTLEGVSFRPVSVRLEVDGRAAGTVHFSGEPTRVTLSATDRPVRYMLTADRTFSSYEGGLARHFPPVSVIFTKAWLTVQHPAPPAKPQGIPKGQ